jgi:ribosomal protein S12 methylthiotransferase accessory factor
MAIEAVKTLTALGMPTLVGAVAEMDGFDHGVRVHRFLQRHDCPACRKKGRPPRRRSPDGSDAVAPEQLRELLVSPHCGVVRVVEAVPVDVTEPRVPLVLRAEVANNRFRGPDDKPFQPCSGKGTDEVGALRSALGEACERYGATAWSADLVRRCRIDELDDAVAPDDLTLFAPDQYDDLPYARWDPAAEIGWVVGRDLATGRAIWVPAVEALLGYEGTDADHLYASTSNGLAAGTSLEHATLNGLLEVIERDAFVVSWLNRLAGVRVDPFSVPHPGLRSLAEAYRRRDVALELYRLPTDVANVSVYAAIGVQVSDRAVGPGPAAVVGLGADVDDARAAARAALEVGQVRPALKARLRDPATRERRERLQRDPSTVESLEDHDLLYSHPDALPWLSFWRDQAAVGWEPPLDGSAARVAEPDDPSDHASLLAALVEALAHVGHRPVACDLTPPELADLGVRVARAVVPGFQPIHFGAREARLGGRRVVELPHRLGLRPTVAARPDLNPLPHPIS